MWYGYHPIPSNPSHFGKAYPTKTDEFLEKFQQCYIHL